jgi:hypothetical protein
MQSEELLELTASEPLSLEAEYDMQRKWHVDEDSAFTHFLLVDTPWALRSGMERWLIVELTFILLARGDDVPSSSTAVLSPEQVKRCRMVGDVNMFLTDGADGEGECEIMIAGESLGYIASRTLDPAIW